MCEYCGYHDIDGDGKIKLGQSNSLNAFYKHIHNFKEPPKTTLWLRDIIDDAVFELAKNRVEAEIK